MFLKALDQLQPIVMFSAHFWHILNLRGYCKLYNSQGATIAQWIRLRLPSCTPSTLFSSIVFVLYLSCEKNENKQKKRPGLAHFLKKLDHNPLPTHPLWYSLQPLLGVNHPFLFFRLFFLCDQSDQLCTADDELIIYSK